MAVCGEPWGRVVSKDENGNAVRIVSQRYPLLSLRFGYLGRANHQESAAASYVLDARQMTKREHWTVQLPRPVEHRVVVEDVVGDTNLELFVADIGGDVVCLNHAAEVLWHRNWIKSLQLEAAVETVEACVQ